MRRFVGALAVLCCCVLATSARARTEWIFDKNYKTVRPVHADVLAVAWPFGTSVIGAAAWFGYPILPEGFTPYNDVLDIEVGAYLVNVGKEPSYFAIGPAGGVRWGLDLTDEWQAFVTAKGGWRFGLGDGAEDKVIIAFSLGALFELSDTMYLRLETGSYAIIQAGLTIPL
jgi:hypothetical protein